MKRFVLAVAVLASSAALAEEPVAVNAGQSWSAVGPKTVASGANLLEASLGWPGLEVSYLRGLASRFNLGGRFSFNYGVEGLVRGVAPGLKLQLLTKVLFVDQGKVSFGMTFEPGPLFYFYNNNTTLIGFAIPVGFRLGIAPASALQLAIFFDLPMWISFGSVSSFNLPILTGVGLEYFVQSSLALFFKMRMGPTVFFRGQSAEFTLDAVIGVGWRF